MPPSPSQLASCKANKSIRVWCSQERSKPGGTIKNSGRVWLPGCRCGLCKSCKTAFRIIMKCRSEWFLESECERAIGKVVNKTHKPEEENHHSSHTKILSILRSSSRPLVAGKHALVLTDDDHFTAAIIFSVTALLVWIMTLFLHTLETFCVSLALWIYFYFLFFACLQWLKPSACCHMRTPN